MKGTRRRGTGSGRHLWGIGRSQPPACTRPRAHGRWRLRGCRAAEPASRPGHSRSHSDPWPGPSSVSRSGKRLGTWPRRSGSRVPRRPAPAVPSCSLHGGACAASPCRAPRTSLRGDSAGAEPGPDAWPLRAVRSADPAGRPAVRPARYSRRENTLLRKLFQTRGFTRHGLSFWGTSVVDASPEMTPRRAGARPRPQARFYSGRTENAGRFSVAKCTYLFIFSVGGAASAASVMVIVQEERGQVGRRPCVGGASRRCLEGCDRAAGGGDPCARLRGIKKQNTCSCRRRSWGAGGGTSPGLTVR